MGVAEVKQSILANKTALGIEFGSTRIKAVLVDGSNMPIASGGHEWENRYEKGVWTYSLEDIWTGIRKNCMFLKMHCMRSRQQNWQDIIRLACMTKKVKKIRK